MPPNGGTCDRRVAQRFERPGQVPYFNGNDPDHQDNCFKFRGNRTHPDLPVSGEGARRGAFDMLHTDVLLVGFEHEKKCANPCPLC